MWERRLDREHKAPKMAKKNIEKNHPTKITTIRKRGRIYIYIRSNSNYSYQWSLVLSIVNTRDIEFKTLLYLTIGTAVINANISNLKKNNCAYFIVTNFHAKRCRRVQPTSDHSFRSWGYNVNILLPKCIILCW